GGDANMGFWFFQDKNVGLNPNGTFSGQHQDGDILIQSSLTTGGGISDIHVYKWVAASGGLVEITGLNEGPCANGKLGTMNACAIANAGTITTPWSGDVASPFFFEGGLNLTSLFAPSPGPCFSTFRLNDC